ncbi:ATP-dependent protease ATPase subunit HslU, partial [Candidatus Bipolaricaulota bacterium]|nr:ATP-dependent protease ATPase subunit HslU [Candidatus Bipolaricaulota bacterium]
EIKDEIKPKNILMIGPTGVGKTEISRRLARVARAPFLKVEATKFTEVGYMGRDVESMIRDLMSRGIEMVRQAEVKKVEEEAHEMVENRILDNLLPTEEAKEERSKSLERTRDKLKRKLRQGDLDERYIEVSVQQSNVPQVEVFSNQGMDQMGIDMGDVMGNMFPSKKETKRVKIKEARDLLFDQEVDKLLNEQEIKRRGRELAEESGIIFLDEIDKIAGDRPGESGGEGPGVSRQGVQRDILPLLEGSTVRSKQGTINTENILFITAGAFNVSKPSDLIPELQGRLPIRVELDSLGVGEFKRILTEPRDALVKQYKALLDVEGLELEFTEGAIDEIARSSARLNENTENIGARRLETVMEKLMEKISFEAPEMEKGQKEIDREYVKDKLEKIVEDRDLSRYIL